MACLQRSCQPGQWLPQCSLPQASPAAAWGAASQPRDRLDPAEPEACGLCACCLGCWGAWEASVSAQPGRPRCEACRLPCEAVLCGVTMGLRGRAAPVAPAAGLGLVEAAAAAASGGAMRRTHSCTGSTGRRCCCRSWSAGMPALRPPASSAASDAVCCRPATVLMPFPCAKLWSHAGTAIATELARSGPYACLASIASVCHPAEL